MEQRSVAIRVVGRCAAWLALLLTPVVAAALAYRAWTSVPRLTHSAVALDDVVVVLALALGAAAATGLAWSAFALTVAPASSRLRATAERATPLMWRRVVATATGGALAASFAAPALASVDNVDAGWVTQTTEAAPSEAASAEPEPDTATPAPTHSPENQSVPTSDAAPVTETPDPETQPATTSGPNDDRAGTATVTVSAGDSLWDITADALGATDAGEISTAWPELYDLNRDTLGADPDVIHPGQELELPAGWSQ